MDKNDALQEILFSEIKSLHHASLRIKNKILTGGYTPEQEAMSAVASARMSKALFAGIALFQRLQNNNTQTIKVEKLVVKDSSKALIGNIQIKKTKKAKKVVKQVGILQVGNGLPDYEAELAQQEFFEGCIDSADMYADRDYLEEYGGVKKI